MADLWAEENFDFDDRLNTEIWRDSRSRGALVVAASSGRAAGGWQDRWASPPLPWVPDLVGRCSREPGGVVVIGSTYAPFVAGSSGRHAAMSLASYATARSAGEFGRRFLASVVRPDTSYYGGLRQLLGGITDGAHLVVTDFCRASFVERRSAGFFGGDDVVHRHSHLFDQWVDAGADWTTRRIQESGARVIVLLGELAWSTLERLTRAAEVPLSDRGSRVFASAHPATRTGELVLGSKAWKVLRVAHPSRRNTNDPAYAGARRALAALLGTVVPVTAAPGRLTPVPVPPVPDRPAVATASGTVVGLHFVCRGSMNVRVLPNGTFETGVWVVAERHARTAEYVALHESKSEPSYRQGRILGYRSVEVDGRQRLVFRVAPDAKRLQWVGEGTGEKGYCYR